MAMSSEIRSKFFFSTWYNILTVAAWIPIFPVIITFIKALRFFSALFYFRHVSNCFCTAELKKLPSIKWYSSMFYEFLNLACTLNGMLFVTFHPSSPPPPFCTWARWLHTQPEENVCLSYSFCDLNDIKHGNNLCTQ